MKRFLIKIGIFLVALIVADKAFGMLFSYMAENAKGGYVGHHKYITDKLAEDILIFGSSRAIHHYNPQIISDSLGMSCYNCGQDGNGIILFYGLWQMIKERYHPKMIIYDVSTTFDLYEGDSNQRYLGWLRSDYDRKGVKQIFSDVDPSEAIKMQSNLYRYNSKFLQVLTDYVHPIFHIGGDGFLPLKGEMDKLKVKESTSVSKQYKIDSLKIKYLNKFISEVTETDSVKLFFVVSPSWYGSDSSDYQPLRDLCKKRNVMLVDYSGNRNFVHCDEFFKDGVHLNAIGADTFTKELIRYIK